MKVAARVHQESARRELRFVARPLGPFALAATTSRIEARAGMVPIDWRGKLGTSDQYRVNELMAAILVLACRGFWPFTGSAVGANLPPRLGQPGDLGCHGGRRHAWRKQRGCSKSCVKSQYIDENRFAARAVCRSGSNPAAQHL